MSSLLLKPIYHVLNVHQLDAIAFVPGANFRRVFNCDFHLMERPLVVIVPVSGDPVAIVPNLEMDSFEGTEFSGHVFNWLDETGYEKAFVQASDALPQLANSRQFGLEAQRMRAFEHMALAKVFPEAGFVDAHQALSSIRLRKLDSEITLTRKAIEISESALEATLQQVKIGQSETEIQSILMQQMLAHGADGFAFEPIIAAGDNSALPHATARADYQVKVGDALLIDFGASYQGYNADITRTVFVSEVSDYNRAFYESVLAANEAGKAAVQPGVSAHDVDDAVQIVLENSRFSEFALHKTGHGLGLDVHEAPQIMRGNPPGA